MQTAQTPNPLFSGQNLISTKGELLAWLTTDGQSTQTTWYVNPYTIFLAERGVLPLRANDNFVADGNIMAKVFSCLVGAACESLNFDFSSCADDVFKLAERQNIPIAIIGGTERDLDRALQTLSGIYPELSVVYSNSGYFDMTDAHQLITELKLSAPRLVVVSMGSPRQEIFSAMVGAEDDFETKLITSGAFISQIAERGPKYYPDWIVRYKLRWAYRMARSREITQRAIRYYIPFLIKWRVFGRLSPLLSLENPLERDEN